MPASLLRFSVLVLLGIAGLASAASAEGGGTGAAVEDPEASTLCVPDMTTLCLLGGRYRVRAEWQALSEGTSGPANAVPLSVDTGALWFFQASNVEVVVKVLDGCASNRRVWVFAGGLTNVGVTLHVTDTLTLESQTYTNPPGVAFQPIQDTVAFSDFCL